MNLYYNGVDIYGDVSVNYCVHEMFAEKQADTLVIRFNDTKGTWSKWQPAEGDTVQFKEGASDTGKMFVHSMKPENGLFTIRAMSMPKSGKTKKSKSWEGVRFLQLANEFAGNHGLTFQNYGCADQVYPYIKQDNETDFTLFHRLCTLEGCQMLIFDGKLLAYNEQYIEGQTPAGSLSVDENGVFSYEDNPGRNVRILRNCKRKLLRKIYSQQLQQLSAPPCGAYSGNQQCRGGTLRQGAAAEREQVRPIRILFQVTYDRICSRQHFDTINTKGNHVGRYRFCV